jgi:hypothetical protein
VPASQRDLADVCCSLVQSELLFDGAIQLPHYMAEKWETLEVV